MSIAARHPSNASSVSSTSSRPSLKVTTQDLTTADTPKPNPRYYAHLLYCSNPERERIMARSTTSSSSRSSSVRSAKSHNSSTSPEHDSTNTSHTSLSHPPVTPCTKAPITPLDTTSTTSTTPPHYPLITTTNPHLLPSTVPATHPCHTAGRVMAQVHNVLIRALNSMSSHALLIHPSPPRTAPFLHFCRVWVDMLHHHHHIEESYCFPEFERLLNKPGSMGDNVEGHESFMPGLLAFEKYVKTTKPAEYDGLVFRQILDGFAGELVEHLHEEIPTLMGLWGVDAEELQKVWDSADKMAGQGNNMWEVPCMLLGCVDREMVMDGVVCEFPPVPKPVRWLVGNVFARRYRETWRFAPFKIDGSRNEEYQGW